MNYNAITNPPAIISFNNPSAFISTLNISGNTALNNTTTCMSSLNVSGITTLSSKAIIYGTSQLQQKISLTGNEYYTGTNTNSDGIGLMLGVNRTDNRPLFICDTAKTAINTTICMIRMGVNATDTFIDSMATDGTTRKGLNLGSAFYCQANNYGSMNKFLKFPGVAVADDRAFRENLIFNEGAIVGGVFGGDVFLSGYVGRIVIATGKIATDINKGNDNWELQYDKNGIFIADSHPIIELSRKKKMKSIWCIGRPKKEKF